MHVLNLIASKSKFVKESAKKMSTTVSTHLKAELGQLERRHQGCS